MATTSEMLNYVNKWGYKDLMKETKLPKDRLTIILKRSNSMESKDMKRDRIKVEEAFDRIIEAARLKEQKLEEVQNQQQNNQVYQVSQIPQQNQNNQNNQTPQKQTYQNKAQAQQRTQNIQKQEQKPEVTTTVTSSPKCEVSEEVKDVSEGNKYAEFSIKLKRIMNEKKISAVALIRKSGLSQSSISRYLRGAGCPKKNAAKLALAKALEIPVSDLFDGENIDESMVMTEIARESVAELSTTSGVCVKRMSPEIQRMILTFSDGSLLIVRGTSTAIEIDYESVSDPSKSIKRKDDFHNYINANKYLKYLKIKSLQNLFAELGIPEKDFEKEIAIIADL